MVSLIALFLTSGVCPDATDDLLVASMVVKLFHQHTFPYVQALVKARVQEQECPCLTVRQVRRFLLWWWGGGNSLLVD